MRLEVTSDRIVEFFKLLGREADQDGRVYLVGGGTAVLFGWRETTIDIDLKIVPETDSIFHAIQQIKQKFLINIEIASPDHFIPPLPGWEDRSLYITSEGKLSFYHFDFYSQALAKIERSHQKDLQDVSKMIEKGLIETDKLIYFFQQIEPNLFRYPSINPSAFRKSLEEVVKMNSNLDNTKKNN